MTSVGALRVNSWISTAMMFAILSLLILGAMFLIGMPLIMAFIIVAIIMLIQWGISASIVEWSTKVHYLKPGENPFLEQMVVEMCERAQIRVPRLGIVVNPNPNAFVWGRSQRDMRLAVHTGLLERLNKNEIRAVIGHEIGHIKHNDAVWMTFLSVIPLIAYFGTYLLWARGRDSGGIILFGLLSLVMYYISFIVIRRLSRIREYASDAFSADLTGDPHALSSALVKITFGLSLAPKEQAGRARQFYIADNVLAASEMASIHQNRAYYDLNGDGVLDERELELALEAERGRRSMELTATHPPTWKRIQALRAIEEEMRTGTR